MMLKNNNSIFISELSASCMRANGLRNIIAVFAIILTTILFTSVATVTEGSMQSIKEQQIRMSGMAFMFYAENLSEATAQKLAENPAFSETGKMQYLGEARNLGLDGVDTSLVLADQTVLDGLFVKLVSGSLPEAADEVLVDTQVLKLLGLTPEPGQTFKLEYTVNGEMRAKQVRVSGIFAGDAKEVRARIYISEAFMKAELDGAPIPENGSTGAGSLWVYGSFTSQKQLMEQRAQVLKDAGLDPDAQPGDAGFVPSDTNDAYMSGAGMDVTVVGGAVILVLLVVLAGYLIISNIFRISIMKDMRMYGQLKTIGTTPTQLRRLLKKQAGRLCLVGIPLGLICGYGLGLLLLPAVLGTTRYTDVGMISPKLWVFVAAAVFAFATVWMSSRRPAKIMSELSPIQALRYESNMSGRRKQVRGRESRARILRMAAANLTEHRGKTFLVVLSLSLSIILFNCVLNFTGSFSEDSYVRGQRAADFVISHGDYGKDAYNKARVLPEDFLDAVGSRGDIENNGAIYCYEAPRDAVAAAGNDYSGIMTVKLLDVNDHPYPLVQDKSGGKMLFSFDPGVFSKCTVAAGSLDMEKLATGKYVLEATTFMNNDTDYDASSFTLKPGDQIRGAVGGTTLEYEVLANVVVPYGLLSVESAGEGTVLILPSEAYMNHFPGSLPIHYVMDARSGAYDAVSRFIDAYIENSRIPLRVQTDNDLTAEFDGMKKTYSTTGGVLAAIFGIIGVLNLLNVILTNAIARQQEFAIMQSIGMTRKQLRRLFVFEALMYAALAAVVSLILSAVLSVTVVKAMTHVYWFSAYQFTLVPACSLIPVYLIAAAVMAVVIDRCCNNGSVVERLRRAL